MGRRYALRETNALVEEFMLLANTAVAARVTRAYPRCAMLRRHPAPSKRAFDALVAAAETVGITLDVSSSKALADSLDAAVLPDRPQFNRLLRILTTRCMMQARARRRVMVVCIPESEQQQTRWAPRALALARLAAMGGGSHAPPPPVRAGNVLLFRRVRAVRLLPLRPRDAHLYAFHVAHPPLRGRRRAPGAGGYALALALAPALLMGRPRPRLQRRSALSRCRSRMSPRPA